MNTSLMSTILTCTIIGSAWLYLAWETRHDRRPPARAQRVIEQPDPWQLPDGIKAGQIERLAPMVLRADRCGCRHLFGGWLVPCRPHDPRHNGDDLRRIETQLAQMEDS